MVPAPVSAMKDMQDPRGILSVHDMATKDYLKFYKEDKYWNMKLKEQFNFETTGLWIGNHTNKYNGRIFNSTGIQNVEDQMNYAKIDSEMEEAVSKHGLVDLPTTHVEDFYNRIDEKRRNLTGA